MTTPRRDLTVSIDVFDDGSAELSCSICGQLRGETVARLVAGNLGALAKSHASVHAVAAAAGIPHELIRAELGYRR